MDLRASNLDALTAKRPFEGGKPAQFTRADAFVLALLLGLGAMQFALYQRGRDFYTGDIAYVELARSILQTHSYGFDFRPETTDPPGLPAILAVLQATIRGGHDIMVRSIVVFATLGFLATYLFLRREEGRAFAAAVTVLLMVSPTVFAYATTMVMPELPYLFTSMSTLLLAVRLDRAQGGQRRQAVSLLCGVCLIASVLIRSVGIALLAGLIAWLSVSFVIARARSAVRIKRFGPILVAGLIVEALWIGRIRQTEVPPQWPIGGYQQSYTLQLRVKNGNEPELGSASLADLPARIERNLSDRTVGLLDVMIAKATRLPRNWFAPWVFGPIVLILIGLGSSIRTAGGQLYDWYFVAQEAIYLVWPWDFETRFVLPVAPLACLYLWRGSKTMIDWAARKPQTVASMSLLVALLCGTLSAVNAWNNPWFTPKIAVLFWLAFVVAVLTAWIGQRILRPSASNGPASSSVTRSRWEGTPLRIAGVATVIALAAYGVKRDIIVARSNLTFDLSRSRDRELNYSQILAAKWIRDHTRENAVVMARGLDVVYYYADRRVVWFPPLTNPELLMEGIRKYHVGFVIVIDRAQNSYWRPAEEDCFERLSSAYPEAFKLVQEGAHERVFEVAASMPSRSDPSSVSIWQ
jgi:hypothetical protein